MGKPTRLRRCARAHRDMLDNLVDIHIALYAVTRVVPSGDLKYYKAVLRLSSDQ